MLSHCHDSITYILFGENICTMSRWNRAQQAERRHSAHTSVVSDQEAAKNRFESSWEEDISVLSDKNVLAVGGGTGLVHGLDHPKSLVSVDPLYEAKQILPTQTNAEIVCGGGEHLSFKENSFGIVISHNVLDHTHNPNAVLDEISRVLKRDGQFLFTVNTFSIPRFIRNKLGLIDTLHPHHFNTKEVEQMLHSSGFRIEKRDEKSHWFNTESTLSLLKRREFKKVAGKYTQIKLFSAICRLD